MMMFAFIRIGMLINSMIVLPLYISLYLDALCSRGISRAGGVLQDRKIWFQSGWRKRIVGEGGGISQV